jgi:hypothetical protein
MIIKLSGEYLCYTVIVIDNKYSPKLTGFRLSIHYPAFHTGTEYSTHYDIQRQAVYQR